MLILDYLLRSMLFLPGDNEKFLRKAMSCDADALILDLEDAVPEAYKQQARETIRKYMCNGAFTDRQVFIRVNELGTDELVDDLKLLNCPGLLGIVPPKICTEDDIRAFDTLVSEKEIEYSIPVGRIKLAPLIETAAAVMNIREIAQGSKRLIALLFGGEDYLANVWGNHFMTTDSMAEARAMIVMAARMNNLVPIDTPFLDLKNEEGYKKEEKRSAAMGFAGNLLMTPSQIEWAHECFSPDAEEINLSKEIVRVSKEAKEQGNTITKLNGKMIGPPIRRRAEKVFKLYQMIEESVFFRHSLGSGLREYDCGSVRNRH